MDKLKGQSTLEALIAITVLVLILSVVFSFISKFYYSELDNNRYLQAKMELESLAFRSNFISTSTAPYTKTSLSLPPNIGYSENELTRINDTRISAAVLAEIKFIFDDKSYVVNRLTGEPI